MVITAPITSAVALLAFSGPLGMNYLIAGNSRLKWAGVWYLPSRSAMRIST